MFDLELEVVEGEEAFQKLQESAAAMHCGSGCG